MALGSWSGWGHTVPRPVVEMREPAGGQEGGRHWQAVWEEGHWREGVPGGRRGMARFCIYCGRVGGRGIPSSHMAAFLPQGHQALKTKPKKSQTKPNKKCMCGAPVMFWIFPPILTVGYKGPVFPRAPSRAWSVPSTLTVQTSLTSAPCLLGEGGVTPPSQRKSPPPGSALASRSPNFLSHLAPPPGCLSQAGRVLSA